MNYVNINLPVLLNKRDEEAVRKAVLDLLGVSNQIDTMLVDQIALVKKAGINKTSKVWTTTSATAGDDGNLGMPPVGKGKIAGTTIGPGPGTYLSMGTLYAYKGYLVTAVQYSGSFFTYGFFTNFGSVLTYTELFKTSANFYAGLSGTDMRLYNGTAAPVPTNYFLNQLF